jgi:hypothetical protein
VSPAVFAVIGIIGAIVFAATVEKRYASSLKFDASSAGELFIAHT